MNKYLDPNVPNRPRGLALGYLRVSGFDQNAGRQLTDVHLDKRFTDYASGSSTDRPALENLIAFAREGDTVVVHSMDRLARNVYDLRRLVSDFNRRGVYVQFIKENLTFTGEDSPMANLLLSMLGAVAEFERDLILERQREGIALGKHKGHYKGRPKALKPPQVEELRRRLALHESPTRIGKDFGVSRQSVYRYGRGKGIYGELQRTVANN